MIYKIETLVQTVLVIHKSEESQVWRGQVSLKAEGTHDCIHSSFKQDRRTTASMMPIAHHTACSSAIG